MLIKRDINKCIIGIFVILGCCVIYDLLLWRQTLYRIDLISSLKGKTASEAFRFIEDNQNYLAISSVQEYQTADQRWLILRFKKTGVIGVFLSWLSPCEIFAELEISGMLRVSIDDGRISTCQVVF